MTSPPPTLHRLVSRTRVVLATRELAAGTTVGIAIGAGVGLVLIGLARAVPFQLPGWSLAVVIGLAAGAGAVLALRRIPSRSDAARHLDRRFALRDRIGTVAAMARMPSVDEPVAALVTADATRAARGLRAWNAVSWRLAPATGAALAALLSAASAWIWLPARSSSSPALERAAALAPVKDAVSAEIETARRSAQERLAQAVEQTASGAAAPSSEQLERLEELSRQLESPIDSDAALAKLRDESSETISAIADDLERKSSEELVRIERDASPFRALPERDAPLPAAEFDRALRDGRFADAAQAIERLRESAAAGAEADRRALAEYFDSLARDMADSTPPTETAPNSSAETTGNDERSASDPSTETPPTDQPDAGPDAVPDQPREPNQEDSPRRDWQDAFREMAERLRESPPDRPESRPPSTEAAPPDAKPNDATEQAKEPRQAPGAQQPPGAKPNGSTEQATEPRQAPGAQQAPAAKPNGSTDQATEPRQAAGAQQAPAAKPNGSTEQATEPRQAPGTQQAPTAKPNGSTEQATEPRQAPGARQQPSAHPNDSSEQATGRRAMPGAQPGQGPHPDEKSGAAPGAGERREGQPSRIPDPSEVPNAERLLRELAQRRSAAEQTAEEAQSLREQAQRLLEQSTPAERERLRRWTELAQREGVGGPGAGDGAGGDPTMAPPSAPRSLVDVDLTGQQPGDQVVAEWLSDEPPPPGTPATASTTRAERFEQARRVAERAVEDATVPSRYHRLVRRYFGRVDQAMPNEPKAGNGAAGAER